MSIDKHTLGAARKYTDETASNMESKMLNKYNDFVTRSVTVDSGFTDYLIQPEIRNSSGTTTVAYEHNIYYTITNVEFMSRTGLSVNDVVALRSVSAAHANGGAGFYAGKTMHSMSVDSERLMINVRAQNNGNQTDTPTSLTFTFLCINRN